MVALFHIAVDARRLILTEADSLSRSGGMQFSHLVQPSHLLCTKGLNFWE